MKLQRCINALIARLPGQHAIVSPGSRNAPVIYALSNSGIQCHSVIDERSAGFVALGIAKETRQPVILSCTSGTAALNYYPAIAEAFYARVPLIVITADRPPEQIDAWDGQAIQQNKVFSNHIRGEFTTSDEYLEPHLFESIADQVVACLQQEISGPIQINVPIREPFYDFTTEGISAESNRYETSNDGVELHLTDISESAGVSFKGKKVLVFNGMDDGENIHILDDQSSVILSDITSNRSSSIHYWDSLLFSAQSKKGGLEYLKILKPDILISTGTTTVSKGVKRFLQIHQPEHHFHISSYAEVGSIFKTEPIILHPEKIRTTIKTVQTEKNIQYRADWQRLTDEFEQRFSSLAWDSYNEFTAVNYILSKLPNKAILHLGNSMPVRYVSFLLNREVNDCLVYANRGTSGIDGCTSTALGNSLVTDKLVYLLTGDISYFYDVNALFQNSIPANLKIIILNNNSGGIFNMIPGPDKMGAARTFQTTPHQFKARHLASHFNVAYFTGDSIVSFAQGLSDLHRHQGAAILELFTDQQDNSAFFQQFKEL